jgi:hypothetical protein
VVFCHEKTDMGFGTLVFTSGILELFVFTSDILAVLSFFIAHWIANNTVPLLLKQIGKKERWNGWVTYSLILFLHCFYLTIMQP